MSHVNLMDGFGRVDEIRNNSKKILILKKTFLETTKNIL